MLRCFATRGKDRLLQNCETAKSWGGGGCRAGDVGKLLCLRGCVQGSSYGRRNCTPRVDERNNAGGFCQECDLSRGDDPWRHRPAYLVDVGDDDTTAEKRACKTLFEFRIRDSRVSAQAIRRRIPGNRERR